MVVRRDFTAAEDAAIFALRGIKWSGPQIAAALGRSPQSLESHLRRLKHSGVQQAFKNGPPQYPKLTADEDPIDGEAWVDVPSRGLAVSSHGRVRSMRSGLLRRLHRQAATGSMAVNFETADRRGTVTLVNLLREAAGVPREPAPPRPNRPPKVRAGRHRKPPQSMAWYRPAEDDAIRAAASLGEAQLSLPHRSAASVKKRAFVLGVRFGASGRGGRRLAAKLRSQTPRGRNPEREVASAAVPKSLPPDMREDLISDIILMRRDGFRGSPEEAFKIARTKYNRMFDYWKTTSIDAPIRGTEDLRLSDVISSDHPHF